MDKFFKVTSIIYLPCFTAQSFLINPLRPGTLRIRSNKYSAAKEILPARGLLEIDVGFLEGIDYHTKYFSHAGTLIISPLLSFAFVSCISALRLHPTYEGKNLPT